MMAAKNTPDIDALHDAAEAASKRVMSVLDRLNRKLNADGCGTKVSNGKNGKNGVNGHHECRDDEPCADCSDKNEP